MKSGEPVFVQQPFSILVLPRHSDFEATAPNVVDHADLENTLRGRP